MKPFLHAAQVANVPEVLARGQGMQGVFVSPQYATEHSVERLLDLLRVDVDRGHRLV
jgi:hypothetical protein